MDIDESPEPIDELPCCTGDESCWRCKPPVWPIVIGTEEATEYYEDGWGICARCAAFDKPFAVDEADGYCEECGGDSMHGFGAGVVEGLWEVAE